MMKSGEQNWAVFFDESGNFGDVGDDVLVAGIAMLRGERSALTDERLRREMESAVPGAPWPLHARVFRDPAGRAWCLHNASDAPCDDIRSLRDEVIEIVESGPPLLGYLTKPNEPNAETLRRAREWLQEHRPLLHTSLEDLIRRDLERLTARLRAWGDELVAFIGAVPRHERELTLPEDLHWRRDPADEVYLEVLESALERMVLQFRKGDGPKKIVWLYAEGRRGVVRGSKAKAPLMIQDVGERAQRAIRYPHLPDAGFGDRGRLRFVPAGVLGKADAPAGLVIADFVAHGVRRVMRSSSNKLPFDALARRIEQEVGVRVVRVPDAWPEAGELPTLAIGIGEVRGAVRRCFEVREPVPVPEARYAWIRDQACVWIEGVWGAR